MAYKLNDVDGFIADGPSINGLREVKALLAEYKDQPRPALEQLLEYGHTTMLPALSVECANLANKTNDVDIKHTLKSLAAAARNAKELLIMEH
jgi:hypothetical protein